MMMEDEHTAAAALAVEATTDYFLDSGCDKTFFTGCLL
jgi:hypothetical protein